MHKLLVLVVIGFIAQTAAAHGVPPTRCPGGEGSVIKRFLVTVAGETVDALAERDLVIDAKVGEGYDVSFEVQGVTGKQVWYRTDAYGFGLGVCADANLATQGGLQLHGVAAGQAHPGLVQDVSWGTWPDMAQVRFQVRWH